MIYTIIFILVAFLFSVLSYIVIELRSSNTVTATGNEEVLDADKIEAESESESISEPEDIQQSADNGIEEKSKPKLSDFLQETKDIWHKLKTFNWVVIAFCTIAVGFITFFASIKTDSSIEIIKVAFAAVVISSAGIVDLHIKKIPNF